MTSERQEVQWITDDAAELAQAAADAEFWHSLAVAQLQKARTHTSETMEMDYREAMSAAAGIFDKTVSEVTERSAAIALTAGLSAAHWESTLWNSWSPANSAPLVARVGQLLESGAWDTFTMPALIPLIGGQSLLIKCDGRGRSQAVAAAQSFLLRLLATVPPGKLRYIFVDPVGLGQNVAPFMRLADFDEALVTSRAWTEPHHIEQRLADLTEHMENVIQKYLRNEYAGIEEFNANAGEVAEPYRVLVVHDFPANFSESAARRLVSLVQNGPRCGVYAVIHADPTKPLPHGFDLADLERSATVISHQDGRFNWADTWPNPEESFATCNLELDAPPLPDLFNRIVASVGQAAKDAARVEVPFNRIAPKPAEWWKASSQDTLTAPLGPSGAQRFQILELGRGTAQHALVAGKTGSGKSTLLHVLINGLAMAYSPHEVELYLIDFKKGVEFKDYAVHALPHARVIAIESEREFSLSALQGLDAELKRRGDMFRAAQVDSLAGFRQKTKQPLPRALLLVDEFQEFFVDDDPIASQAAQLLDRLVRQGRAFGIHVLLGSQTLAGAYSLARSTIDQMAVRIALQCSEADSRLILADDNGAARLLTRPGEAIYNNANGLVEGNSIFQVAFLRDDDREGYLTRLADFAQEQGYRPSSPQIIFEGNAPANIEKNQSLTELLTAPIGVQQIDRRRALAWLGDPIAIKDPIAAHFRRQSGSNLLIVGQNEEAALGMISTAIVSLAAQHKLDSAVFYVLDFGAVDHPHAGRLHELAQIVPQTYQWGRRRELASIVGDVASELERRQNADEDDLGKLPATYLVIYGLQRARDLRVDDSYSMPSYSLSDEPALPNPAQQFPAIIQHGPDMGIHTLVWCDTVANLNRALDRRVQREFETRVAFQMSAEDSAMFVDTPAAAKLGLYRALLVSEEEARLEKFRPYDLPTPSWLEWVRTQLAARIIRVE